MIQDIWEDLFHFSWLAKISAWAECNMILVPYHDNERTALKLLNSSLSVGYISVSEAQISCESRTESEEVFLFHKIADLLKDQALVCSDFLFI